MAQVNRDRLRELVTSVGPSARALSLQAQLGPTAIKDILSGKSRDPGAGTLASIAAVLKCDVRDLLLEGEAEPVAPPRSLRAIATDLQGLHIRGMIQAGSWEVLDHLDQSEPEVYPASPDPRYPRAAQWLSRVRGDSMNALTKNGLPAGILEGDLVHLVDAIASDYRLTTGDVVEVERIRFDGAERELTLKQVEVTPDGALLWPRSTNPRWHEPIRYVEDVSEHEEIEVRVRGKVLQVLRQFG